MARQINVRDTGIGIAALILVLGSTCGSIRCHEGPGVGDHEYRAGVRKYVRNINRPIWNEEVSSNKLRAKGNPFITE